MTFDPFGDFETRGYLRNLANEKDLEIVRRLEHTSFTTGIDAAFARSASINAFPAGMSSTHIKFYSKRFIRGPDKIACRPLPISLSAKAPFCLRTQRTYGVRWISRCIKLFDVVVDEFRKVLALRSGFVHKR